MAWSREIRLPFLDYRLVNLLLPLDPQWKLRDGWTKWIFRPPRTAMARSDEKGLPMTTQSGLTDAWVAAYNSGPPPMEWLRRQCRSVGGKSFRNAPYAAKASALRFATVPGGELYPWPE